MMKVNGKEVEWKDTPEGQYLTDVKEQVLWKDEKTGAMLALRKIPKGGPHEAVHIHPDASHWMFLFSGVVEYPDGRKLSVSENDYFFLLAPKGESHGGLPEGAKITQDFIGLWFFDGPQTKVSE
jgi:2,4'-dihydroxyacetophenone dioxygenase